MLLRILMMVRVTAETVIIISQNQHSVYVNLICHVVTVSINGVLQASEDIEVAAFINNECRGTEFLIEPYPTGLPGQYYTFLTVFGNNDDVNATITFKAYDHATSTEYTICDLTLPFSGEEEAQYGGINQGYYMNFFSVSTTNVSSSLVSHHMFFKYG